MNILAIDADKAVNDNYKAIISLLIGAVTDWPTYNLSDFNVYLLEVRAEIKSDLISTEILTEYLQRPLLKESSCWMHESIASFIEALDLMKLYALSLEDVISEMERLANTSIQS